MSKSEDPQTLISSTSAVVVDSPLKLVVYPRGGKPEDGIDQKEPPFKLCHGAEHRLDVKAPDGSTWVEQMLSLHWQTGQPTGYGLSADPPFLLESTIPPNDEESFKRLSGETGAKWILTATGGKAAQSGENLKLALGSYWQALKHEFLAHVGDFRYDVTAMLWDGVVPIVDQGNTTKITATVVSAYTSERPIIGAKVKWTANGRSLEPTYTDADGNATCEYKPEEGDIDDTNHVVLKASCTDELGQDSERPLNIVAYKKSPWQYQLRLVLRELPDKGQATRVQGEKSENFMDPALIVVRLTRGGNYELSLIPTVEEGNVFIGKPVRLGWPSGEGQLGIVIDPLDDRVMPKGGLTWRVTGGNNSGFFTLQAFAEGVGFDYLLQGVQMSANLAEEADLEVDAEDGLPPIFHRGKAKPVRIVPKTGSPLGSMALKAKLRVDDIEGEISQGQVPSAPTYGAESLPVEEAGVQWELTARGSGNSGQFGLTVEMPGFTTGLKLEKALALSGGLGNEARVLIRGVEPGSKTVVLRRHEEVTIELKPRDHSGLGRTQLKGWLTFESETLDKEKVPANPGYDVRQAVTTTGLKWVLTGGDASGSLKLTIHVEGFANQIALEKVVLISNALADEAELKIDDEKPSPVNILSRNSRRILHIVPKPGSVLRDLNLKCHASFMEVTLKPEDVISTPNYTVERELGASGLEWALTAKENSGRFAVAIHVEGFEDSLILSDAMVLSRKLGDEAVLKVDGEEAQSLTLIQFVEHEVSLEPRPGSPLGLTALKGWMTFESQTLEPDQVKAQPAYNIESGISEIGLVWKMSSEHPSGNFSLAIFVETFDAPLKLPNSTLLEAEISDHLELKSSVVSSGESQLFWRNDTAEVMLCPKAGGKLPGNMNIMATLAFVEADEYVLPSSSVEPSPAFGAILRGTVEEKLSWSLRGNSEKSGLFSLQVYVDPFKKPLILEKAVLLSERLYDEAEPVPHILPVFGGAEAKIKFRPESPLLKSGLKVQAFAKKDEFGDAVTVKPGLTELVDIPMDSEDNAMAWKVERNGRFEGYYILRLTVEGYAVERALIVNLQDPTP